MFEDSACTMTRSQTFTKQIQCNMDVIWKGLEYEIKLRQQTIYDSKVSALKSSHVWALTLTLGGFHQWSFITAATLMLLGRRTTLLLASLHATSHSFPVGHHRQVVFMTMVYWHLLQGKLNLPLESLRMNKHF